MHFTHNARTDMQLIDEATRRAAEMDKIRKAAEFLASHQRGRDSLKSLKQSLIESLRGLDGEGRNAYLIILNGAWNGYAGSVPLIIDEALIGPHLRRK